MPQMDKRHREIADRKYAEYLAAKKRVRDFPSSRDAKGNLVVTDGQVEADPQVAAARERYEAAVRHGYVVAERHAHAHAHANPSHHIGTCGPECRAGREGHAHRDRRSLGA